jgi:hypothetical protein
MNDKTFQASVVVANMISIADLIDNLRATFQQLIEPFLDETELIILVNCDLKRVQKASMINRIDWEMIARKRPLKLAIDLMVKEIFEQGENPFLGGLSIGRMGKDDPCAVIEVGIKPGFIGKIVTKPMQTAYVNWATTMFEKLNGITGYITLDYDAPNATGASPYEISVGLLYQHVAKKFHKQVRGYYWGNFLSRAHVETLGGEGRLRRIPAFLTKKVGSVGYYVQLTEDVNSLQLSDLAKLKEILLPLLPKSEHSLPPDYERSWPYFLVHDDEEAELELPPPVGIKSNVKTHIPESEIYEAKSWLANTTHPAALAVNRFGTTQAGQDFVENLYRLDAQVIVQLSPFADPQNPHADALIVKLPVDPKKRKKIFSIFTQELVHEHLLDPDEVVEDNGEEELFFWWD